MAVRVFRRFAEIRRNCLFEPRRNRMFERFGLGIDFAPVETENLRQKQLDETMSPYDPSRGYWGAWDTVRAISLPLEFAERPHDTGFVLWHCAEPFGNALESRLVLLFLLLELKFKLFDSMLCFR